MKQKVIIQSIFFCMLSTFGIQSLHAGGKKKQKEVDDFAILELAIKQKKSLENKSTQKFESKINEQQKLKEELKAKVEQNLCAEYPLLSYFKIDTKQDITQHNMLEQYLFWLQSLYTTVMLQNEFIRDAYNYAEHWDNHITIYNEFKQAWGDHIQIFDKDKKFKITYANRSPSAQELSLCLRYNHLFSYDFESWDLTDEDYCFLETCLHHEEKQIGWIAHALLKTDMFKKGEIKGQSLAKSSVKNIINPLKGQISQYDINIRKKLFKNFAEILTLFINSAHAQSEQDERAIHAQMRQESVRAYEQSNKEISNLKQEINRVQEKIKEQNLKKLLKKEQQKLHVIKQSEKHIDFSSDTSISKLNPDNNASLVMLPQEIVKKVEKTEKKQNTNHCFFKIEPSNNIPYNSIHMRVELWLVNPEEAYQQCKQKYSIANDSYKEEIMVSHTLPWHIIDSYIYPLAIICDWKADNARPGDKSYNIPCSIEIDGRVTNGVISYGINNKQLFHRCFSQRAVQEIRNDIIQRTYNAEFPSLDSDKEIKKQNKMQHKQIINHDETDYIVSQNSFYVQIQYTNKQGQKIVIKLIKMHTKA
jgi:hypothetical protein